MQQHTKKFKSVAEGNKLKESIKGLFGRVKVEISGALLTVLFLLIEDYEKKCYIWSRLNYTMDRYVDIMFYMYFSETEFRRLFHTKKGFCLPHLKILLEYAKN